MQIYVGNLPHDYRLSDLVHIFETYGCVSRASAVRDFAFLAMFDNEAARAAVNGLNGNVFLDHEIVVEQARFYPRNRFQNTRGGFARGGGQRGGRVDANEEVYQHQEAGNESRVFYGNPDEGYLGDHQGGHAEVTHPAGNGSQEQTGEIYIHDTTYTRGRGFGRGGRRGGFRRGRGACRGGYRAGGDDQQAVGGQQSDAAAHVLEVGGNGGLHEAVVIVNVQQQPRDEIDGERNAASDGGDHGQVNGGAGCGRGSRRAGRGSRGGRGGSRGAAAAGGGPAHQQPAVAHIQLQGGSGDNIPRNAQHSQPQPVHQSVGAVEGTVADKVQLGGGAGYMHVLRHNGPVAHN